MGSTKQAFQIPRALVGDEAVTTVSMAAPASSRSAAHVYGFRQGSSHQNP